MRFLTSRPGKTNEYFGTKLGKRDYVGKIYKLTKFGADRLVVKWLLHMVVKYNGFVTFFSRLFSVSSASLQVAILVLIAHLMAQKSFSD